MIMHQWTPPSPIPIEPNNTERFTKQRLRLRWMKLFVSTTVPIIIVTVFLLYFFQQNRFFDKYNFNEEFYRQKDQVRVSLDRYYHDVSNILLQPLDSRLANYIEVKTRLLLRNLDPKHKEEVLRFLLEQNLLQTGQINAFGMDLRYAQLTCPDGHHQIHLAGVIWSHAIIRNCRLSLSNFNGANLSHSRFINCTFQSSSFQGTNLAYSYFEGSTVVNNSFQSASLVQSDFLQMNIVQGNNYGQADLYRTKMTDDQLQGKYISIIPHDFDHARLPNGSFHLTSSEQNLLKNGNADLECQAVAQTYWLSVHPGESLGTEMNENIAETQNTWGNCSFVVRTTLQVYQTVNLYPYSLLIDTHHALMTFAAYATCEQSSFHINLYRSDGILQQTVAVNRSDRSRPFFDNQTMYEYTAQPTMLSAAIRSVRLEFGIESSQAVFPCYFDNINLLIRSH